MQNPSHVPRRVAAISLVLTAGLMVVSTALAPPLNGGGADQLAAVNAAAGSATVSAMCFTMAQLFFVVGMVGVGQLLWTRTPVLATCGVALAVLGGFGHTVHGGVTMVRLQMASDVTHHTTHAAVLQQLQSGSAASFMLMGLLGTVLGILVLSIGLFRSPVVSRWVPAALWVFLFLEFVGSGLVEWAGLASGVFYVIALVALASTLWRGRPVNRGRVVGADSPGLDGAMTTAR